MKTTFKEQQQFRQWWLTLILIIIGLIPIFGIYKQLILKQAFGNMPMSDGGVILMAVLIFATIALIWSIRLNTEIDQNAIKINLFPFAKKTIKWHEIKQAKIVDYGFIGGWGIRYSSKYGTVYNIKGSNGLAIELKTGKKFLIGTQKEEELRDCLNFTELKINKL